MVFGSRGVEGRPGPVGQDRHVPEGRASAAGRASRTDASRSCSRVSSWAAMRSRDSGEDARARAPAPTRPRARLDRLQQRLQRQAGVRVDAERRVVGLQLAEVRLDLDRPGRAGRTCGSSRTVRRGPSRPPAGRPRPPGSPSCAGPPARTGGTAGASQGNAPLPPKVVTTGAFSRSASCQQLAGRVGAYDPAARDDRRAGGVRQQVGGHARSVRGAGAARRGWRRRPSPPGSIVSASSTSCGISTHTGPCGAVSADSQAAAIADGIWDCGADRVDGLHHVPERGLLVRAVRADSRGGRRRVPRSGSGC